MAEARARSQGTCKSVDLGCPNIVNFEKSGSTRQSGSTRATGYLPHFSKFENSGMLLKADGTAAIWKY